MAPAGSAAEVDVAGILTKLAAEKKEKLDWRTSIVDLMKLLDLDSSHSARKELAQELHYSGNVYCGPVLRHPAELMLPAVDLGGRVWLDGRSCKGGPAAPAFGG